MSDSVEHHVAVVGMSCRFPGAPSVEAYWDLISGGGSGLTTLDGQQLRAAGVPARLLAHPDYVPVAGLLEDPTTVDPEALGLSETEAELMDPQQRLVLECSIEALEAAGLGREGHRGIVGVFAGQALSSHLIDNLGHRFHPRGGRDPIDSLHLHGLNVGDYLPARVAWQLGLTGPTVAVGATCATSLVAIHLAVDALLGEQCDTALAGGVSLRMPQEQGYLGIPDGPFSRDGRTRAYGAGATGTVFTQGVGIVALRRLGDALADGDPIHAVVLGSAIGNDGPDRVGFAAPSVSGQARVIAEALAVADVDPREVELIEGHGTGTRLGDPIEVRALGEVFGPALSPWCSLGSVKSMIGHTDSAAGVAGFIKAVLAVEHGLLPPTLDAEAPNEDLPLAGSPFALAIEARPWTSRRRIAGVSAFGIGGINAHAIIGSAPSRSGTDRDSGHHEPAASPPLLISAADPQALEQRTTQLTAIAPHRPLAELAGTLAHGSRVLRWRHAVVSGEPTPACEAASRPPRLVAVMPGGGAQYAGMAAGFHAAMPTFSRSFDTSAEMIVRLGGRDPRHFALDRGAHGGADTRIGLPALAVAELAYLDLLADYGVALDVALGHSLGEYAAAVVAGAMDRQDALHLVIERARLFSTLPAGAMLSLALSADEAKELLAEHPQVELAAVNGPLLSVVAGREYAVAALEEQLDRMGIDYRRLPVAVASHSPLVEPVLPHITALSADFARPVPTRGLITSIDGSRVDVPLPADHWARHLRSTVRFDLAIEESVRGAEHAVVLQAGPGGNLLTGVASSTRDVHTCWTDRGNSGSAQAASDALARTLGTLWSHGIDIDLDKLAPRRCTVALPAYPWQRRSLGLPHRLGVEDTVAGTSAIGADSGLGPSRREPLQLPSWRQEPRRSAPERCEGLRVALAGEHQDELCEALTARGLTVEEHAPAAQDAAGQRADLLVHVSDPSDAAELRAEASAFAHYARTFVEHPPRGIVHLTLGAEDVLGSEVINPFATATTGLVRVLGQEVDGIGWTTVDLDPAAPAWDGVAEEIARLHEVLPSAEKTAEALEVVQPHRALRGSRSWSRRWESWHPASTPRTDGPAVWIVTGGLGSVGLALAARIEAEQPQARIVLAGRTLPEPGGHRAEALAALHRTRAELVDVAVPGALTALLARVWGEHGRLDVVVHAPVQVDLAPLAELDDTSIEAAFAPKVTGALELAEAVTALPAVPRVLLLSSVAGTIGGFGLAAYVTAGRFLDGFAEARGWTTLDLDRIRVGSDEEANSAAEISMRHAIDLEDAVTTILRVIDVGVHGCLAASPTELNTRTARLDSTRSRTKPAAHGSVGALTGWEGVVAEVWSRILSRAVVSAEEDFFALGGHSLLATRVLAAFRNEYGIDLRLRDLLAAPTVKDCAVLLDRGSPDPPSSESEAQVVGCESEIADSGETSAPVDDYRFGLTRVQHAYWIGRTRGLDPASPEGEGVGCHFYLEYAATDLDVPRYQQAWRDVVSRHPMLRAVITRHGEHRILDLPADWAPQFIDLSTGESPENRLAELRKHWSTRVADPARWPLIQPVVVRMPGDTWRVLLSVDVLVCDSASWMIVDQEVRARYLDPEADLGPVPPSFAACLAALEDRSDSARRATALQYWRSRLDSLPEAPRITAGTTGGGRPHFTRLAARVPAATWQQWGADCRGHRLTPTALVLSFYRQALARWSGDERFAITISVFDRPDISGVDRVVGEFSTMVLHTAEEPGAAHEPDMPHEHGSSHVWERARATQDRLVEDLDHREVSGIEVLAEWSRRRGRTANIPVVFTSMIGIDRLSDGPAHDHEWLGAQVHGVSQTPQVWLDHQAFEHRGDLVLQWDVCDTVVDLAEARRRFDDYVASFGGEQERVGSVSLRDTVVTVWADLLGLDALEIGDESFLSLGGDSLLAVRMATELRRRTGTGLPLNEIRADITIAELLELLSCGTGVGTQLPLERRPDKRTAFPLLPLQQGYFVGQSGGWDNSYCTAHVSTDVELTLPTSEPDPDALEAALQRAADAVAAHQPMVTAQILPDGTQRLRAPDDQNGRTPARVIDLRSHPDPEGELDRLRAHWAVDGPDPQTGPAVAVDVVLLGNSRGRLHVSSSLLVMDGWSTALYDRELFAQLAEPGTLVAPLELDFGDYVASVTSPQVQAARNEHRRWWWERINSLPPPPRLPRRAVTPAAPAERMTMREFRLDPASWQRLRDVCRRHEVTPATAVLGAFALALQQLTGQSEILLNSMQHNRVPVHADVDRLIGAFSRTALLPLRLRGGTILETVRTLAAQVDEHGRYDLVTAVEVGRELGRRQGRSATIAPVVFQSTLGMDSALGGEPASQLGPLGRIHLSDFHQDIRTPQVELELRVFELEGTLIGSLASVDEVLAEGVPEELLAEVQDLVEELLDADAWTAPRPDLITGRWEIEIARTSPDVPTVPDGPAGPRSAGPESRVPVDSIPPGSEQLAGIGTLWSEMLGLSEMPAPQEDFFSLGGDSLLAVRMLARLRDKAGIRVSARDFLAEPTPAGVLRAGNLPEPPAPVVRFPDPGDALLELRAGTGHPVFLLHPSGGDVLCYVELARLLDTDRPVLAIPDPSLDGHPMPATIGGMVEVYRNLITERQPDGPWTLGGWSMGGTMAHELARRISADGGEVAALLMIDSNSPERIIRLSGLTATDAEDAQRLRQLRSIEAFLGLDLGHHDSWQDLAADLTTQGVLPNPTALEQRFEVFRRHMEALAGHEAGVLDASVPVLLIRAMQRSPRNSGEGMGVDDIDATDLGWTPWINGSLTVTEVDSHHYSVVRTPAVREVAAELSAFLQRPGIHVSRSTSHPKHRGTRPER